MKQIKDFPLKAKPIATDKLLMQDEEGTKSIEIGSIKSEGGGGSRGYFNQVMADYPDIYYRLGETSGSTVIDNSGFDRNGYYSGDFILNQPSLLVGDVNPSYKNSTRSHATFSNIYADNEWINSSGITIDCLVKLDSAGTNGCIFAIGKNDARSTFKGFSVWSYNGNLFLDVSGVLGQTLSQTFGTRVNHVAAIVRKNYGSSSPTFVLCFNGKQVYSVTPNNFNVPDLTAYIGKSDWGGNLNAWIDEFAIYGCELPASRIYAHYKASLLVT